jgi:hypothetical protein
LKCITFFLSYDICNVYSTFLNNTTWYISDLIIWVHPEGMYLLRDVKLLP